MRLDQDQLEWIVREVIRRLQAGHAARGIAASQAPPTATGGAAEFTISDNVVTTAKLEGRLQGVRRLRVAAAAVVTPAVKDMLKDRNVELVRGSNSSTQSVNSTTT